MSTITDHVVFDPQIIRRFDINGPRYTSYPTADRFAGGFSPDIARHWLRNRRSDGSRDQLSLYFHLPFCTTICYYCACNKIITKDHGRSAKYLRYIAKEVALQSAYLPKATTLSNSCTGAAVRRPFFRTTRCAN